MKSVACFFILSKEPKLWTKMGEQPATLAAESIFSHIPRNWQKNRASNDLKVWRLGGRTATPSSWYEVRLWLEPFILLLFCWQLLWNSNRICACKVPLLFRRAFWSKILTSVIFEKQDFRFFFFPFLCTGWRWDATIFLVHTEPVVFSFTILAPFYLFCSVV